MKATTPAPTRWPVITKDPAHLAVTPNLVDYDRTYAAFRWEDEQRTLAGLAGGRVNIAHEAVDRHAHGDGAARDALRFVRADGSVRVVSFGQLADETGGFASVLRQLGVQRGDRVFSLLGRTPPLY